MRSKNHLPVGDSGFRLVMTLPDGTLVRNRAADKACYVSRYGVDVPFVEYMIKREADEKGVKVLSYEVTDAGVNVNVCWK